MSTPSTSPTATTAEAPAPSSQSSRSSGINAKRHLRNYLLDARFQLKFTAYIVAIALCVATILGGFLWTTSKRMIEEAEVAVDARQKAAETSKELSNATLSNMAMEHLNDPAFAAQFDEESKKYEREYETAVLEIKAQKSELLRRQQYIWFALVGCMAGFVIFIGIATIVTTHHIVGPLFRIKRLVNDVAGGHLKVPEYPLRERDELKDVFEAVTRMVRGLRERQEADAQAVVTMIERASRSKAAMELVPELQELESKIRARLG